MKYPTMRARAVVGKTVVALCAVIAVVGCALSPRQVMADQWTADAGVDMHYKYDDNARLRTDNKTSLYGVIAAPHAKGTWRTERAELSANLGLEFEKYDKQQFDSNNQDLTLFGSYAFEHNSFSVTGSYNRDSTLSTELTDTGRFEDKASRRTTRQVQGDWQWQISPRQMLDTTLSYQDASYNSNAYIGYHFDRAATIWSYLLTENLQLQLQPYASRYESQDGTPTVRTDTYGLQGGFAWQISEHTSWSALLGGARQNTEYDPFLANLVGYRTIVIPPFGSFLFPVFEQVRHDSSNSLAGQTRFTWQGEYWGVTVNGSSQEQPSADGIVRQVNQVSAAVNWHPLRRMRVTLRTLWGDNTSSDNSTVADRTYAEISLRTSWQFAEQWWVRARYRYRRQDYSNRPGSASGNALFVTLSWQMPAQRW